MLCNFIACSKNNTTLMKYRFKAHGKGCSVKQQRSLGRNFTFQITHTHTHTHGVGSCNANNYSSFKMMNVEWAENDLIKFGVWIISTAHSNGSIKQRRISKKISQLLSAKKYSTRCIVSLIFWHQGSIGESLKKWLLEGEKVCCNWNLTCGANAFNSGAKSGNISAVRN